MANSGFGEVYSVSWWGNFSADGFGNIYYDIAEGLSELASNFVSRVEADGGTVESAICIDNANLLE